MIVGYKNQDQRSKIIRNMDHCVAHDFLCHNDNHDDCDGGMDCSADPERLKLYNKAFEELPEEDELPISTKRHHGNHPRTV